MHIRADAIVLSTRNHGEHGVVARALTREHGVQPGYVRGGRSRRLRPVLQPANLVLGEWRTRTGDQLAGLTVELVASRAALHEQPLAAAGLQWATTLGAAALPEAQPYPHIHDALDGLLDAIEAAPSARAWAAALARYELVVLAELGFGLDLERCAVTGEEGVPFFVSPRSGSGVSRAGAVGYEAKLLPFPRFLAEGGEAGWDDVFAALRLSEHFLTRDVLVGRSADTLAARARLIDGLRRAVA